MSARAYSLEIWHRKGRLARHYTLVAETFPRVLTARLRSLRTWIDKAARLHQGNCLDGPRRAVRRRAIRKPRGWSAVYEFIATPA